MRRWRWWASGVLSAALFVVLTPAAASAHPLGNFTVNQFSGLRVAPDAVEVELIVDMAEIPALRERSVVDTDDNDDVDAGERAAYAGNTSAKYLRGLSLTDDGRKVPLVLGASSVVFPPGQAGLATLRLTCALRGPRAAGAGARTLEYRNTNLEERLGWREVVAVGDGATLARSSVPRTSVSARLTSYPDGLLDSPLDVRSATMTVRPGGPGAPRPDGPAALLPRGVDGPTQAFTSLIASRRFDLPFALFAVAVAMGLGALHAAAPGHGKTVMAAYLLGERASLRQAAIIGATVTTTHTVGVLMLGIALSVSTAVVPARLYPLLSLASGVLVVSVGLALARRAWRVRQAVAPAGHPHDHAHADHAHDDHAHADGHAHGADSHDHHGPPPAPQSHSHGGRAHTHALIDPGVGWRSLVTVGVAGGMVPSPSALVVLLGASALGRAWFGVILVLAFGVGMAGTLTAAGFVLARARDALERRRHAMPGIARLTAAAPVVAAVAVTTLGLLLTSRAVIELTGV